MPGLGGRKYRRATSEDVRAAFHAPTLEWAHQLKREAFDRWAASHPQDAEWLETALKDGPASFAFPEAHRRRIRSTHGLERFNQEIKRRTRVVRICPNPDARLRLVTALCMEQSEEWLAGRVYLDMGKLDGAVDDRVPLAALRHE